MTQTLQLEQQGTELQETTAKLRERDEQMGKALDDLATIQVQLDAVKKATATEQAELSGNIADLR